MTGPGALARAVRFVASVCVVALLALAGCSRLYAEIRYASAGSVDDAALVAALAPYAPTTRGNASDRWGLSHDFVTDGVRITVSTRGGEVVVRATSATDPGRRPTAAERSAWNARLDEVYGHLTAECPGLGPWADGSTREVGWGVLLGAWAALVAVLVLVIRWDLRRKQRARAAP